MIRLHFPRCGAVALATGCLLLGPFHSSARAQGRLPDDFAKERLLALHGTPAEQELARLNQELKEVIIPRLEFKQTTLADAVEYLRQESRRIERSSPSLSGASSINVILRTDTAGTSVVVPSTRITLTLERIPLLDALRYVAAQAGLKVQVEPYAVSLVPLGENDSTLKTAVFRVPPTFFGSVSNGDPAPHPLD